MYFLSTNNLIRAYNNVLKRRKNKYEAYEFNLNIEYNLQKIIQDLKDRKYEHWKYRLLIIRDSKKRYISSPKFRDHILHHMVYNITYPVLDKRIVENSFATRIQKWHHKWLKYFTKKLRGIVNIRNDSDLYFMKIDVSKYFYSISHKHLKNKIFKYIKNENIKYAINLIIDSYKTSNIFDNLFSEESHYIQIKDKWLPIWAIHSQLFANFYLFDLDRHVNQYLKPMIYMRYMDDMIFVDTIDKLKIIKSDILKFINTLELTINPRKIEINKLEFWINLLWYRVKIIDNKIKIELNKNNKKKYWKMMDKLEQINFDDLDWKDKTRVISMIESRESLFKCTGKYDRYTKLKMVCMK
jgi:RNA-directed DNA polymerase